MSIKVFARARVRLLPTDLSNPATSRRYSFPPLLMPNVSSISAAPSELPRDRLGQRRLPFSAIDRSNGHGECFSTAHKYSQLLGSRHSRVDEVPKQHLEMLCVDRNDDRFKLTPLRFMDGHRIRKSEFGQILF